MLIISILDWLSWTKLKYKQLKAITKKMFALALVKRMCSGDLNKFLALSSITLESLAVELEKFED